MKTVSIADIRNEGVSKVVREAQHEPVLIRKGNEAAAWIVSAEDVLRAAEEAGGDPALARHVLEVIAVDLFHRGVLSMGQATRLVNMPLADFASLCDRLLVPVFYESEESVEAEADALHRWLQGSEAAGEV